MIPFQSAVGSPDCEEQIVDVDCCTHTEPLEEDGRNSLGRNKHRENTLSICKILIRGMQAFGRTAQSTFANKYIWSNVKLSEFWFHFANGVGV